MLLLHSFWNRHPHIPCGNLRDKYLCLSLLWGAARGEGGPKRRPAVCVSEACCCGGGGADADGGAYAMAVVCCMVAGANCQGTVFLLVPSTVKGALGLPR